MQYLYINYVLFVNVNKCLLQAGMMVTINSTKDLSVSVGRFYLPLNKSAPESPIFSLPYMDMADQSKLYNEIWI